MEQGEISGDASPSHSKETLPPTNPSTKALGDCIMIIDPGRALTSNDWLNIPRM